MMGLLCLWGSKYLFLHKFNTCNTASRVETIISTIKIIVSNRAMEVLSEYIVHPTTGRPGVTWPFEMPRSWIIIITFMDKRNPLHNNRSSYIIIWNGKSVELWIIILFVFRSSLTWIMDFIIIKLSFDYCQIKSDAEYEICCDTSIRLSGLKPKCCLIKSSSKQKSSKYQILDDQGDVVGDYEIDDENRMEKDFRNRDTISQ